MMPVILLTVPICGLFWKLSSFLNIPGLVGNGFPFVFREIKRKEDAMSRHSTAVEADRPVPPEAVQELLPSPNSKETQKENQQENQQPRQTGEAAPRPVAVKSRLRQLLLAGTAVALLAGAGWYGWDYWTVGRYLVSTDDAYVKADNTTIAPKATGYGSVQNAQQAQSRNAGAEAAILRDTANLASARKQVELLKAEIAQAVAAAARASAQRAQAELNLSYTTIISPIDGVVGNRTLRTGQYVQAGTQLMSLVPATGAYVVANFKETQLTDVRDGQAVDIAVDMFPGQAVHGHVDSIAPASGQEFALLPPDNATGNFTKIVQRIPVKIALAGD